MDEQDLRKLGLAFRVGDDLYGISVDQLEDRRDILKAEIHRIERALVKKSEELSNAETFFNKS